MPISQSDLERQEAAAPRPSYCEPSTRRWKPARIESAEELEDLAEDQLALAPGVAGVHDRLDVLAREQLLDRADALRLALLLLQLELPRKDGERVERPALVLGVDVLGREQLDDVAHRERDDAVVRLPVAVVLGESAQRGDDVARDARLLRDDQRFCQ